MNDPTVTFQGWLGGEVRLRSAAGVPVASFRVASTPRRFHRATNTWSDGPTQWFTVTVWRGLAEHCADSLRRGDPVVVHGRLSQSTWVNSDNVECSTLEVEAAFVGHDLNRGRTRFTKTTREPTVPQEQQAETPAADPAPGGEAAA
jgi:single-strand DNA-binding protein